jgi:hypothetical protein
MVPLTTSKSVGVMSSVIGVTGRWQADGALATPHDCRRQQCVTFFVKVFVSWL